ncbi:MAG TPA: acyltransferase [Acetobacteraceae bacterium]|nr:acyltransferase [Acetobacteraceae bacterium]
MTEELSIYLDLIRFLAAFVVFFSHICGRRFTGGLFWQVPFWAFGQPAVDVFFVLSGFVIAHATQRREGTAAEYALNRTARMYSVVIPALVATFLLDDIGRCVRPHFYARLGITREEPLWQYASALLFVGRLWFAKLTPGSNVAYWSVAFEVWYYIIFGLFIFGSPKRRWALAGLALAVAGPRIDVLFPLWLAGVASHRVCARARLRPGPALALAVAPVLALACYYRLGMPLMIVDGRVTRLLARPFLVQDYLVGIAFAVHLIGVAALGAWSGPMLRRIAPRIRWLAGATFTLYLFHVPVSAFLVAIVAWPVGSWPSRAVTVLGTLAFVFAASITERRKDLWRRWLVLLVLRTRAVVPRLGGAG